MSADKRALILPIFSRGEDSREECQELGELAAVAGYFCVAMRPLSVRTPKVATLIGGGTIDDIKLLASELSTDVIIIGADLSSVQARNLEKRWQLPIIDRSDLILEIFQARARVYESKIQVQLARSRRQLSRLAGQWTHLERQRGGIGLRGGPGEKQLEIDRRLLATKIKRMERNIDAMSARNMLARARRAKNGVMTAALVGYTNAGKSTLFNALTRAATPANNRLFDTLESSARRVYVGGQETVLADTVGFIRNLPHELLAGFRATLAEAAASDIIIVVADAASANCDAQLAVVHKTLDSIGAADSRRLLVMNKIDKTDMTARIMRSSCGIIKTIWLSGLSGDGVAGLRRALSEEAIAQNKLV